MLIAPIFHNSYLSPKLSESQNKPSDAVSTGSLSKVSDTSSSNKYNNIFKSAFNKGITFFSKITSSSRSNTPSTSASTGSKPAESEINNDSSSSDTPSACSSPDSLKTEMIFFKPIIREPKTPSNTKPVLLRIPSIRSTVSSTDPYISSPCPSESPVIPITPKRQSAFSLVGFTEESKDDCARSMLKPKALKRRNNKPSPKKPEPKRVKQEVKASTKSYKTARKVIPDEEPKEEATTETIVIPRKTRSMDKKGRDMAHHSLAVSDSKAPKKSPQKKEILVRKRCPQTKKAPSTTIRQQEKSSRVTRSQTLKH